MRAWVLGLGLALLAGCGTDEASAVAKLGWQFNYKDFTDDAAADDVRGCGNQPAAPVGPNYATVTKVRVFLEDPEGQNPGMDKRFDCKTGEGSQRVPIRGVVRQKYNAMFEALDASEQVLYRYTNEAFDLSTYTEDTYSLETATGELHFFPTFAGSSICPNDVTKFRYALYPVTGGVPATSPSVTGVQDPACEDSGGGDRITTELFIRAIPVAITGPRQTFNTYKLVVEALDASDNVLHCAANSSRAVKPGDGKLSQDESLAPGACP